MKSIHAITECQERFFSSSWKSCDWELAKTNFLVTHLQKLIFYPLPKANASRAVINASHPQRVSPAPCTCVVPEPPVRSKWRKDWKHWSEEQEPCELSCRVLLDGKTGVEHAAFWIKVGNQRKTGCRTETHHCEKREIILLLWLYRRHFKPF